MEEESEERRLQQQEEERHLQQEEEERRLQQQEEERRLQQQEEERRRQQEEKERRRFEEEEIEMETDEADFFQQKKVRLELNSQLEDEFRAELKQNTNWAASRITKMVNFVFNIVVEKEELLDKREEYIARYRKIVENMKFERTSIESEHLQMSDDRTEMLLREMSIVGGGDTGSTMAPTDKMSRLEATQNRMGSTAANSANQHPDLLLRIERLQKENAVLMNRNRQLQWNSSMNSLSRIGEEDKKKEKETNETLQITASTIPAMTSCATMEPRRSMPRKSFSNKETARYEKSNDTLEGYSSGDNEESFVERKPGKTVKPHHQTLFDMGNTSPEVAMLTMMQQMHIENSLPDPPIYTAETKSVSIEAFQRAFKLKYGRLTPENQVVLLEAKFVGGRALKVFKSIAEHEKDSFDKVLAAMANRMRISEEDESHRARTRWEKLQRRENQSIEDYCLKIDEFAKRAFVGMSSRQVSSLKTTKLLNSIVCNEHIAAFVTDKIDNIPEHEKYEVARQTAIRMERAAIEREQIRNEEKGVNSPQQGKNNWNSRNSNRMQQQNPMNSSQNFQTNQVSNNNQYTPTMPRQQSSPTNNSQQAQSFSSNQYSSGRYPPKQYQPAPAPNGQWRQNSSGLGFSSCTECQQTGCHAPNCSKAVGNARAAFNCNNCQAPGHFAKNCPNEYTEMTSPASSQNAGPSVSTLEFKENVLNEVKSSDGKDTSGIRYEKGNIEGIDVDLLLDSGASISLMPQTVWSRIVAVKGKGWESRIKKKPLSNSKVKAVNNGTINVLFEVTLETSMRSRTREISICIADVQRDNVILGMNNFGIMGVRLVIEGDNEKQKSVVSTDRALQWKLDKDVDELEKSKLVLTKKVSKVFTSDTECLESENVPNCLDGEILNEKLGDYHKVASVLCEGESVAVVEVLEKSAKGIAEDSVNMLCCEDKESGREQKSYTEFTHASSENIGVCEKHVVAEDSIGLFCGEVETAERNQTVRPLNAQSLVVQQSLQKENMVNTVIDGLEVRKEVREGCRKQICERTGVSAQRKLKIRSLYTDQNFSGKAIKNRNPSDLEQFAQSDEDERSSEERRDGKELSNKSSVPYQTPLHKEGLQKEGDVAIRGVFQWETRYQLEAKPHNQVKPLRHPTATINQHPGYLHMGSTGHARAEIANIKDPPDSLHGAKDGIDANARRHMENAKPRKCPPGQGHLEFARVHSSRIQADQMIPP